MVNGFVTSRLLLGAAVMLVLQQTAHGEDSKAKPAVPQWNISCAAAAADAPLQCRMTQELFAAETRQRVLAVTVSRSEGSSGFDLTLAIPHGAFLPAGVALKIDDKEPVKIAIESSNAAGVYARVPLDEALGTAVKRGVTMTIGITNRNGNLIQIPVSLAGFTAALSRIAAIK